MLWRPGRCAQFAGTCGKPEAQPLRTRVVELYPPLAPSRGYGDAAPPGGGAAPRPRGGALALLGLPHAPSAIYGPLFDPHSASSPRRRPGRASSLIFCTPAGARQPRRGKHPPINRGPRVAVEMNAALAGDAPRSTEHRHGYEAARSLRPEPATTRCCRRKARAGLDGEYTHARIHHGPVLGAPNTTSAAPQSAVTSGAGWLVSMAQAIIPDDPLSRKVPKPRSQLQRPRPRGSPRFRGGGGRRFGLYPRTS